MSTSTRSIKWVENLAEQENRITAGERTSIDLCRTKDEVLSTETMNFIQDLFHHFEYFTRLFNNRVTDPLLQVRLLKTDSPEQYSILRNDLKLTVSAPQPGVIQLQCDKVERESLLGASSTRGSMMFSGRVEARYGTFHDMEWFFLGNKVNAELLARHYLTEFIQSSRSSLSS